MKTLTESEFRRLLEIELWVQHVEVCPEGHSFTAKGTKDGKEHECAYGYITVVSKCGDITVSWTQGYSYFLHEPSTFEYAPNGDEYSHDVSGCTVVDEDGEELSEGDMEELLGDFEQFTDPGRVSEWVSPFKELYEELYEDEKIGEGSQSELIDRDYRPDVDLSYDGYREITDRAYDSVQWEVVKLYGLKDGVFVAWSYHSRWIGEPSFYDGEAFTGPDYKARAAEWLKTKVNESFIDEALEALREW